MSLGNLPSAEQLYRQIPVTFGTNVGDGANLTLGVGVLVGVIGLHV
jgi:hypothetical protein